MARIQELLSGGNVRVDQGQDGTRRKEAALFWSKSKHSTIIVMWISSTRNSVNSFNELEKIGRGSKNVFSVILSDTDRV